MPKWASCEVLDTVKYSIREQKLAREAEAKKKKEKKKNRGSNS